MREGIHPDYLETKVVCSCGNTFVTRSTKGGELHIELCSACHPFYTGTQKLVDSGGRVQRFADKFGNAAQATLDKNAAEREARQKAAEEAAEAARKEREAREADKAKRAAAFESAQPRKIRGEADADAAETEDVSADEAAGEAPGDAVAEIPEAGTEESAAAEAAADKPAAEESTD